MVKEYGPDGLYHGGGVSAGGVFGQGPVSDDGVDMDSRMRGAGYAANTSMARAMPEIEATMRSMRELMEAQAEELRLLRAERSGAQLPAARPASRLLERARADRAALDVDGEELEEEDEELEDDEPTPPKKKPAKKKAPAKKKPAKKAKRK